MPEAALLQKATVCISVLPGWPSRKGIAGGERSDGASIHPAGVRPVTRVLPDVLRTLQALGNGLHEIVSTRGEDVCLAGGCPAQTWPQPRVQPHPKNRPSNSNRWCQDARR